MNRFLASILVLPLIALAGNGQSKTDSAQSKTDNGQSKTDSGQSKTDQPQIIGSAEILKIDAKKQILQVRELVQPTNAQSGSPRYGGGGRRGGGRRSGGVGFPGGGGRTRGGGPYPGGGETTSNQTKEYKVFVTKDTVMKVQDVNIDFSYLRVGDRIGISGTPKGTKGDLQATTITKDIR